MLSGYSSTLTDRCRLLPAVCSGCGVSLTDTSGWVETDRDNWLYGLSPTDIQVMLLTFLAQWLWRISLTQIAVDWGRVD